MIALLIDFLILNDMFININQYDFDLTKLASLTVVFIGVGIPVGQLIYQVYFFFLWIYRILSESIINRLVYKFTKKEEYKKEGYFKIEMRWQEALLGLENNDKREFLSKRYGHLLNRVHELGSLLTSLILIGVTQLGVIQFASNVIIMQSLVIVILLAVISAINFFYFDANFNYFRDEFLKKLERQNQDCENSYGEE